MSATRDSYRGNQRRERDGPEVTEIGRAASTVLAHARGAQWRPKRDRSSSQRVSGSTITRNAASREGCLGAVDDHGPTAENGEDDLRGRGARRGRGSRSVVDYHRWGRDEVRFRARASRDRARESRRVSSRRARGSLVSTRRERSRTCSSFQLLGFIGSFHGYGTLGGAFGSAA